MVYLFIQCCFTITSTETIQTITVLGTRAQDVCLNFYTVPELWLMVPFCFNQSVFWATKQLGCSVTHCKQPLLCPAWVRGYKTPNNPLNLELVLFIHYWGTSVSMLDFVLLSGFCQTVKFLLSSFIIIIQDSVTSGFRCSRLRHVVCTHERVGLKSKQVHTGLWVKWERILPPAKNVLAVFDMSELYTWYNKSLLSVFMVAVKSKACYNTSETVFFGLAVLTLEGRLMTKTKRKKTCCPACLYPSSYTKFQVYD